MSTCNRALFSAVVSIVACNYAITEGGYYARNQGSIRSGDRSDSISRSRSSSDCSTIVDRYQPDPSQYEHLRFDDEPMLKQFKHNHAIFDTLSGTSRIEVYEIYKHKTKQEIYCIIKFGNALNGYPKTVHGGTHDTKLQSVFHLTLKISCAYCAVGISALMIDNSYGCLFFSLRLPPAFTANLTLNYRLNPCIDV